MSLPSLEWRVVARKHHWPGSDLGSGPSSSRNSVGNLERAAKESPLPPGGPTPEVELGPR